MIGVGVGLVDFLFDGLKLKRSLSNRLVVTALTFTLSTLMTLQGGTIFYLALTYGGGLGCTFLLGALPIIMVGHVGLNEHLISTMLQDPTGH
ncbi:MAG: aromatic amino acid transport family protein [Candidatus Obscuribacterales bacterium]